MGKEKAADFTLRLIFPMMKTVKSKIKSNIGIQNKLPKQLVFTY